MCKSRFNVSPYNPSRSKPKIIFRCDPMFACAFIPDFSVQAVLRCEAESLKHLPILILEGKPPLAYISALNDVARSKGFYKGMNKSQAEVSNNAVLKMRSPLQEENAYTALLDCAGSLSPRVEATG